MIIRSLLIVLLTTSLTYGMEEKTTQSTVTTSSSTSSPDNTNTTYGTNRFCNHCKTYIPRDVSRYAHIMEKHIDTAIKK